MAEIVAVNRYAVREPDAFDQAAAALAARVRDQGHPGLLDYRFYRPAPHEGRLIARYSDAAAWVGHHDLAMPWPEMAALRAAAGLEDVLLFGPVTAAMRDWIDRMGLAAKVAMMGQPVAGFRR